MRCVHAVIKIMGNSSYAADTVSRNVKPSLDIHEITLDWKEVNKNKRLIVNEGNFVYMNISLGTTECVAKKTAMFRTMYSITNQTEKNN